MENIVLKRYQNYLSNEYHKDFLEEAKHLAENEKELKERFSSVLKFGTAGVRGIIGAGSNRINPYTISLLSQSLVYYVYTEKLNIQKPYFAVISYDSRHYSKDFAITAACVFASHNIKTYLFKQLNPVPLLSFAVRYYTCTFGVMITASHNPPEYNGYKVYWNDGAQVLPPHDKGIMKSFSHVCPTKKLNKFEDLLRENLISLISDDEIHNAYQQAIDSLLLRKDYVKQNHQYYPLIYTPLHGTGLNIMQKVLKNYGFSFTIVEEQAQPDENFSSVKTPNPEDPDSFNEALILAKKQETQLIIATDPDADRLGVMVQHEGEFVHLNGNQLGTLLLEYLISRHLELNSMPKNPYFINSIVSSQLPNKIAQFYGLKSYQVLTGFKHIAQRMYILEKECPEYSFIFAYEESYGFLAHSQVRDKDAISSAVLIAECGLWNYQQNLTLIDRLEKIYTQFGYFSEKQLGKYFYGLKGMQIMESFMKNLRTGSSQWCRKNIIDKIDYLNIRSPYIGQWGEEVHVHPSNVLTFNLKNNYKVCVRPSGTEPKIKFYIFGNGERSEDVKANIEEIVTDIQILLSSVEE